MQIGFKVIDTIRPELGVGAMFGGSEFNILVANSQAALSQFEDSLRRQAEIGRRIGDELVMASHASNRQVEGSLVLRRKLIAYMLVLSVGLVQPITMVNSARAAQTSAAIPVSVSVIANAKMQTHYQATQFKISKADVARGYVEVPAASRFEVSTNSRSGYLMEFYPVGNLFESVQVESFGNTVQFGADGGTIVQRGLLPQNLTQELSFRFTLSADTLPGSYPWPLLLSVRPL